MLSMIEYSFKKIIEFSTEDYEEGQEMSLIARRMIRHRTTWTLST